MQFLLSSMSVVYVLTTSIPEDGDDATVEQLRKRANVESSKELWDSLEAKYMAEDASSKKFLVSCIIEKLPPYWKDLKHTLKRLKEELTLVELGSYLRIEESLRVQDNDKPKINNVAGPLVVNMVEHNNSSKYNDNKGKLNIMITQGLILTRRLNLLVGNVAKLVTLKGIAKVLMLATKLRVHAQRVQWMVPYHALGSHGKVSSLQSTEIQATIQKKKLCATMNAENPPPHIKDDIQKEDLAKGHISNSSEMSQMIEVEVTLGYDVKGGDFHVNVLMS
ncbi:hypothetical protein Tco_0768542 [Tanacetum coccineum]